MEYEKIEHWRVPLEKLSRKQWIDFINSIFDKTPHAECMQILNIDKYPSWIHMFKTHKNYEQQPTNRP